MNFQVRPLRFQFQALDPIAFAPGQAANTFRGAFGDIFRRAVDADVYRRMFEPRASVPGPSGFADLPRPFVLRAASLDSRSFEPGENFTLDINIFDPQLAALDYFRLAFERLRDEGLGKGRPRIHLIDATEQSTLEIDLSPPQIQIPRLSIKFLTPTELKAGGETLREPRFDALFKRARDRVASLAAFYQPSSGSFPLGFRESGIRAEAARLIQSDIRQVESQRRSSRTGQTHGLGGFTGQAVYEAAIYEGDRKGNLAEFLPCLQAAHWTGVGRLTVWGNGMIAVEPA